jgi:hypothetical protein
MIIESTLGEGATVTVRLPGLIVTAESEDKPGANIIAFNPAR